MSEFLVVLRREFVERVRTRTFMVSTLLFPVFIMAITVLPGMMRAGGGERHLALVDEAPAEVGDAMVAALTARSRGRETTYRIDRIRQPFVSVRDSLNAVVQEKKLDGYVVLPPDVLTASRIVYRARDVNNTGVLTTLSRAGSDAVRTVRLKNSGIDAAQVEALVKPIDLDAARLTRSGKEGGSALATLGFSYLVGLLFIQLFALYGQGVMRSVLEEKNNRIVEVMASSVKASHLMAGKVLGLGAVALLQMTIWITFVAVVSSLSAAQAGRFGASVSVMKAVALPTTTWLTLLLYFALGFLFFASLYAALGAMASTEQEAQQMSMPMMILLFMPIIFIVPVLNEPLGSTARLLGLLPFTSPVVMPMRMGATEVPSLEVAGSIAALIAAVLATLLVAGKIYRVGILSTGKRPTLRELGRWLRAA